MASMLERYLGRPIRDTEWWMWFFLFPIVIWAWELVVLYLVGRLVIDMMQYTPSETRLAALAANDALPEIPPPVRPVDEDKDRSPPTWWDIDSVPVGKESTGDRAVGLAAVQLDALMQPREIVVVKRLKCDHLVVGALGKHSVGVVNEGDTARHPGGEVAPGWS